VRSEWTSGETIPSGAGVCAASGRAARRTRMKRFILQGVYSNAACERDLKQL
jgi:hypothetical protein